MFDIDSGKLLIVAVLALIVIGPKELPRVLRQVGQSVGKLRRMASEFQGQFMDAMKEADISDIRKELDELNKTAALDIQFDPVRDIKTELTSAMEPVAITTSENSAVSPLAGFTLPKVDDEEDFGSAGEGFAPVAEASIGEPAAAETIPELLGPVNGHALAPTLKLGKRKILVKRRTSRLNVLQPDTIAQSTGEPFLVRRRAVRAKSSVDESVPSA